ncbi:MAG: hypothetical protein ABSE22_08865 [Xanthobacteraceae bacterium]|jgi:1,4-dihydroxy-2-naphthoate octaprenyltransferase
MPWSAKIILLLAVLLVIPSVGEIAAVLILFVVSIPLGLLYPLLIKICGALGLGESHIASLALFGTIPLILAAYFANKALRQSNQVLKEYYVNASILAVGTPVILGLAIFRLGNLFVTW